MQVTPCRRGGSLADILNSLIECPPVPSTPCPQNGSANENVPHIQPITSESPCGKASTAGCDHDKQSCPPPPKIHVRYEVTKVPQLKGTSCWAASSAMLLGTSSNTCISDSAIAQLTRHGLRALLPSEVDRILRSLGVVREGLQSFSIDQFADLLRQYGPLLVVTPGHARVITGISGDGTSDGTYVDISDPLPVGKGSQYTLKYGDLVSGPFYVAHPKSVIK